MRAHALRCPGAVFSHESAAAVLGLPLFGEPHDIHVFDAARTSSRRFGDVHAHASVDPRDVVEVDGMLCTSAVDTLVDLGRTRAPASALATWDHGLRAMPAQVDLDLLSARWRRQRSARQTRVLRWLESAADSLSESVAESVSRATAEWLGFERPVLQHPIVAEGHSYRGDLMFASRMVVGEVDGEDKYRDASGAPSIAAFRAEKQREERLRRAGYRVVRWGWQEATHPERLERVLAGAGVPRIQAPQLEMLATLRSLRA